MGSCWGDQKASITKQLVKQEAKWAAIEDADHNANITTYIENKRAKMALYRSPDYQINWTFGSEEEVQNRFPRLRPWRYLGFLIGMILTNFDLQVTLMLPTTFQVNWPFGSREEAKK